MTKTIMTAMLLAATIVTTACNTVGGAGRDVQSAGRAVEKAAD